MSKKYNNIYKPKHPNASVGGKVGEQVYIASKALGKAIPKGVRVHHVNYNGLDNRPENLVVCENESYHQLIHRRTDAYDACGDADGRQCRFCKKWGTRDNMYFHPTEHRAYHRSCYNANRGIR